jgi:dipeptide transport system ATP-binding protein
VVETGDVDQVFERPRHPYTAALLAALPEHNRGERRLQALAGIVPGAHDRPTGCLLAPRCGHVQSDCHQARPLLESGVRCFFPL